MTLASALGLERGHELAEQLGELTLVVVAEPVEQLALAVAQETGATPNQVVLAWLMGHPVPTIPLVGASSIDQLQESLDAVELTLSRDQRARLDQAR